MSRLALAEILIPVLAGAGLFVWIAMVVHADRHPRQRGADAAGRDVPVSTLRRDAGPPPRDLSAGGSADVTVGRQDPPRP
jgi:hypothetical protein